MDKPVLFFSHSSKDRDIILPIKDKLNNITGNTVEIFMSSDGQSIPFGSNWIHKVEEGLNEAKLMFVFVTETSLASGWIHFEAGFAYSKEIKVVPVGIGVNIGSLKPPLNLLQGFNITSGDSLNNFVNILNKTFSYTFSESFSEDDYYAIQNKIERNTDSINTIKEFMSDATFDMISNYTDDSGNNVEHDIDAIYEIVINYLESNHISYSNYTLHNGDIVNTFVGIKIIYHKKIDESKAFLLHNENNSFIKCRISLLNFEYSFDLLKKIVSFSKYKNKYIKFHINSEYNCLTLEEDISAIISNSLDYRINKDKSLRFSYNPSGLNVIIGTEQKDDTIVSNKRNYIVINYDDNTTIDNIVILINKLYDIGIIHEA